MTCRQYCYHHDRIINATYLCNICGLQQIIGFKRRFKVTAVLLCSYDRLAGFDNSPTIGQTGRTLRKTLYYGHLLWNVKRTFVAFLVKTCNTRMIRIPSFRFGFHVEHDEKSFRYIISAAFRHRQMISFDCKCSNIYLNEQAGHFTWMTATIFSRIF